MATHFADRRVVQYNSFHHGNLSRNDVHADGRPLCFLPRAGLGGHHDSAVATNKERGRATDGGRGERSIQSRSRSRRDASSRTPMVTWPVGQAIFFSFDFHSPAPVHVQPGCLSQQLRCADNFESYAGLCAIIWIFATS